METEKLSILPEGYTQEQYSKDCEKYGKGRVKIAKIQSEDGGDFDVDLVFVVPDIKATSDCLKFRQVQPDKSWELLVNSCLIWNKEAVTNTDFRKITAAKLIETTIPVGQGVILN